MNTLLANILTVIGGLGLTAGMVAVAGYGLFKWFGEKWLSSKFDQQLEDHRHSQPYSRLASLGKSQTQSL